MSERDDEEKKLRNKKFFSLNFVVSSSLACVCCCCYRLLKQLYCDNKKLHNVFILINYSPLRMNAPLSRSLANWFSAVKKKQKKNLTICIKIRYFRAWRTRVREGTKNWKSIHDNNSMLYIFFRNIIIWKCCLKKKWNKYEIKIEL